MSDNSPTTRSFSSSSMESNQDLPSPPTETQTRLERKDFPSTNLKSASETAKSAKGVTPKQLRFRMISPSNSGASGSFELHQPVIVKPITGPNPVIVKNSNTQSSDMSRLSKKTSFIATSNGPNSDNSSADFHRAVVVGNPTPIEFLMDSSSKNSSTDTSASSFEVPTGASGKTKELVLTLPVSPTNKEEFVSLPKSGRTHSNAFLGVDRPREGEADYYQFQFPPNKRACGVVIPFFNEERRELQRTLEHLEVQSRLVWKEKNLSMHVLLIMDGWSKAADSMRDYVKYMFPAANPNMPWWTTLDDKKNEAIETFFVQKIVPYGKKRVNRSVALGDVSISPGSKEATGKDRTLYITLIVKRDNRRKHNSHEWFFGRNGFSEYYKHEYCFATDCGTLFEPDCLSSLVNYMESHPTVSVCTGRQRVMSKAQQGSDEGFISLDTLFRAAQAYDYESSFACFMGAFALFGFLPVVPGPCGLYRASDLLGTPADWYFEVVNTEPDKSGMILGNLKIAEDRVLSYAAVLKTVEPRRMALIPEATFYFEAECSFEKFLLQRRRWTNGTVAGYIYMCLQNPGIIFRAKMNPIRKLFVYLLLFCQLLVYAVVALSPGIFLTSLHSTLGSIFPINKGFDQNYSQILWYLCIAIYVFMVISHTGKKKYIAWMFYVLMIISWIIIIGAFYTFANFVYYNGLPMTFSTKNFQFVSIYAVILVTGVPLLIALLHSPKSFILMLFTIIPYYLFLPTLVGWFSAYAFARTWDLTWGNRPAGTDHGNLSHQLKAKAESDLKSKAMTVCIFILLVNFAFIFLVQQFSSDSLTVVVLAGFIFTFAGIQMLLSIVYFLGYYDPRRIAQGCWKILSFPFRKKQFTVDESSEDELHAPDFRSEFGTIGKFNSKGPSSSRSSSRTSSRIMEDSTIHTPEIKPSSSRNTAIDVTDAEHRDPAEIVNTPSRTTSQGFGGQVKRTPSVANAV